MINSYFILFLTETRFAVNYTDQNQPTGELISAREDVTQTQQQRLRYWGNSHLACE